MTKTPSATCIRIMYSYTICQAPYVRGVFLILPESRAEDPKRLQRVGPSVDERLHWHKQESVIKGLDEARGAAVRFGSISSDAEVGEVLTKRRHLQQRQLRDFERR